MEICQRDLPYRPWADPGLSRLPGLVPVAPGAWLQVDEAYGAQMAERARILAREGEGALRLAPEAREAADELLELVLAELERRPDFELSHGAVRCPDGREVRLGAPLETLGALVQEDFCLLQRPEGAEEHVLTGAILCFPASWTLAEKFGRPLGAIHGPVAAYDGQMARRVQRLFDHLRAEQPIWRANALLYDSPALWHPRSERAPRWQLVGARPGRRWLRSERQTLLRLPHTGAVAFSIHTYVVPAQRFAPEEIAALETG